MTEPKVYYEVVDDSTGMETEQSSEPIAARLAIEIRRLRKASGLSQAQVAGMIGYSGQYVSLAERIDGSLPSRDLVAALDKALRADGILLALRDQAKSDQLNLRRSNRTRQPAASDGEAEEVQRSQREWLRVRQAPRVRGRELNELAAWLYPESQRAPGGHVLAAPGWLLDQPVELDAVRLRWSETQPTIRRPRPMERVLPLTNQGRRYVDYSRAVRDLVRPRLLENRLSYRLLDVSTDDGFSLGFGTTTFFEAFNVQQSLTHEFKAAWLASEDSMPAWSDLPLRAAIGEPFDPHLLLMSPGISTLTIRRDRHGDHRFVLHDRDGASVADGGGLCHVMPAGEFQPSSVDPADVRNDFSLWRNIMREFSEEFLGNPEHDGCGCRSIDYSGEEPFRSFELARAQGQFRLWHYGIVLDALTLGAAQLTVAVVDGEVFDRLFAGLVSVNDEGRVVGRGGRTDMPFTDEAIDRLDPRLSSSALTMLRLAWRDRGLLLRD